MGKLTKGEIRDAARHYIADLVMQEQVPDIAMSEADAQVFMEEVERISERIRRTALQENTNGK